MYIQMKKSEFSVLGVVAGAKRATGEFPYRVSACRCQNCKFSSRGKCALKECCCMGERVKARSCSVMEMLRDCFRNVYDASFQYRLRLAVQRAQRDRMLFLNAEHRKRFYDGLSRTRRAQPHLIAQIYLLSAKPEVWRKTAALVGRNGIDYASFSLGEDGMALENYRYYLTALDIEYGTVNTNLLRLADEENVDFDVFCAACFAVAIAMYGVDAIKIAEKRAASKKYRRRELQHGRKT